MNKAKTIAVWCDVTPDAKKQLEKRMLLHVNYWHFSNDKRVSNSEQSEHKKGVNGTPDFLDIGLMVPCVEGVNGIFLFLPFDVTIEDIEDISPLLNNLDVVGAIFNENLELNNASSHEFSIKKNGKDFCYVHCFVTNEANNKIEDSQRLASKRVEGSEGLILEFKSLNFQPLKTAKGDISTETVGEEGHQKYIRLRVPLKGKNKQTFVREIEPSDKVFTSGFEKTEFIDFRINEHRLLPQNLKNEFKSHDCDTSLPMSRVDFLLAVNLEADITGSKKEFHKSRFLEPNVWVEYFGQKHGYMSHAIQKGMLVYHWKKERVSDDTSFNDFVAFVKLKVRLSSGKTIAKYTLYAFFIGLLGSLCGSYLYSFFQQPDEKSEKVIAWIEKKMEQESAVASGEKNSIVEANGLQGTLGHAESERGSAAGVGARKIEVDGALVKDGKN